VFWATGFGTGIWASQLPRMKVLFELNDAGLSTVVLAFALGAIMTMPVVGAFTTWLGGVRTVVVTGVAAAVTLVLMGVAGSYPWLLTAAWLAGVSIGGLDVAMNTQATVIERAWGAAIMSGIHAWFSLGGLCGAAMGGLLITLAVPYAAVFGVGAAIALIAMTIVPRWLNVPGEPSKGGPGFAWPRLSVLGIGVLCLLAFLFEGAALDWTAVYMHDVAGASMDVAASGYAGFSLSMAVMRFAGDGFVRRFGPVRVLGAGAGLAAFGIALACAFPRPWAVTVGLTLAGFGQANIVPLLFSAAGRVPGVAAGAGVAMAATMGYGAFLLGPPLIGFLADWVGLRTALLLLVASALTIACSARTVTPR
jgi:MFS family permease